MQGLKILRLQLYENKIFDDLDITFFDKQDKEKEPYTSLIIGPNGTGKSNLLRTIILLFQEINEFKKTGKRNPKISGKFSFEYSINGKHYFYCNAEFIKKGEEKIIKETKPHLRTKNEESETLNVEIPSAIIALSIMLTDKFPTEMPDYKGYTYLGVKFNPSTAKTTTFIRKTVELLFNTLDNDFLQDNIFAGLKFLEYERFLYISYTPRYKNIIFTDDLTPEKFENFFLKFWEFTKRPKESPPWSLNYFKRLKQEAPSKIPKLVRLCKKIRTNLQKVYPGSRSEYFGFNIFDTPFSKEELKLINDLYSLDLISYPSLSFRKKGKEFEIEDSSSGEYHFISGFIGLLAKIQENSLVLIDEPENSLHPNWQMKYISFLKSIFKQFKSCHFIVATHSHFLVSDLDGNNSNINVLRKGEFIEAQPIPSNTYGWSAEEILLNVFQTPSTRNYYLSEELGNIFQLISEEPNERNVKEIKSKIEKLKKLDLTGLSKSDPLKDVVNQLFQKFADA
ncbi:MAG: hypothetical protein RL065_1308 [Bacteroidota bacterium]|jgi:ABC-type cobalamin/Fe3+-siderophores transport system ATPase subunit